MSAIRLDYSPQPRQLIAHMARSKEVFFGGSAGGGKTYFLRWDAVDFCIHCPKITAVIFRRTFPQLVNNHIRPLQRDLPEQIAVWNESHREFRFVNGSVLIFKHMEHARSVEDIQGWDIHYAGIDEGAQFEPDMLRFIRSRMRLGSYADDLAKLAEKQPRIKEYAQRLPRMVIASNPGGESHDYLKQNYIDPAPPETEFVDEHGISKIFIPARMTDNRYLDSNYAAQFAEMPEWQRRQLVEGDWDTIPGAFFDCWDSERVILPFQIPRHWTRFRSMDWGYRTPFSVAWWAVSDGSPVIDKEGTQRVYPEGCMIRYREWYGAKTAQRGGWTNIGLRLEPEEVARRMLDMEAGEEIAYGVADPSIWRSDGGPSVAEKMANSGVYWQRAANDRASGSAMMYQRIARKMLLVFDTCTAFIRLLPQAETDDKKAEEYKKQGADHVIDCARYACASRPMVTYATQRRPQGWALPTLDDVLSRRIRQTEQWI